MHFRVFHALVIAQMAPAPGAAEVTIKLSAGARDWPAQALA